MNCNRQAVFLIGITILLAGCSTIGSVNYGYKRIIYTDGINKSEAKILAKKKIIDEKSQGSYMVIAPDAYDLDVLSREKLMSAKESFWTELYDSQGNMKYHHCWAVVFRPKPFPFSLFDLYYLVIVDKTNGEIRAAVAQNALAGLVLIPLYIVLEVFSQLGNQGASSCE